MQNKHGYEILQYYTTGLEKHFALGLQILLLLWLCMPSWQYQLPYMALPILKVMAL